jgi:hypothetical protein
MILQDRRARFSLFLQAGAGDEGVLHGSTTAQGQQLAKSCTRPLQSPATTKHSSTVTHGHYCRLSSPAQLLFALITTNAVTQQLHVPQLPLSAPLPLLLRTMQL